MQMCVSKYKCVFSKCKCGFYNTNRTQENLAMAKSNDKLTHFAHNPGSWLCCERTADNEPAPLQYFKSFAITFFPSDMSGSRVLWYSRKNNRYLSGNWQMTCGDTKRIVLESTTPSFRWLACNSARSHHRSCNDVSRSSTIFLQILYYWVTNIFENSVSCPMETHTYVWVRYVGIEYWYVFWKRKCVFWKSNVCFEKANVCFEKANVCFEKANVCFEKANVAAFGNEDIANEARENTVNKLEVYR